MKLFGFIISLLVILNMLFFSNQALQVESPTAVESEIRRISPQETRPTEPPPRPEIRRSGNPQGRLSQYRGLIAHVDENSLILALQDGSTVIIMITPETRIRIPRLGKRATVEDLQPGQNVNILATLEAPATGIVLARFISVVPERPTSRFHSGIVIAYEPGMRITVKNHVEEALTFLINDETRILPRTLAEQLAIGACVTVFPSRSAHVTELTAKLVVIRMDDCTSIPSNTIEP